MKTIFLAESEIHVLEALRLLFGCQPDYELVGQARSAASLLARAAKLAPDAILLDWNLPDLRPQRAIPALRRVCPAAKIVALSVKPEHAKIADEFGLDGFISKQLAPDAFLELFESIMRHSENVKENP